MVITRSRTMSMSISNELKDYFSALIEPLATQSSLNELFKKFKTEIVSKLEHRIKEQDKKN